MNIKKSTPVSIGRIVFYIGVTTTTIGHYADLWIMGYCIAIIGAIFSAFVVEIMNE